MWTNLARKLGVPWRTAEAMHWSIGAQEMASRAGVTQFIMKSEPSKGGDNVDDGLRGAMKERSDANEVRGAWKRRRTNESGQGIVLPRLVELGLRY